MASLEHVNITVSNAEKTAEMLCQLFDWHIRWQGEAMNGLGRTVHVGSDTDYVALYTPRDISSATQESYDFPGGFNHIGVLVDDLEAAEERVKAAGYTPVNHGNYEPGRRFYFRDEDNVEYELVSYD